MVSVSVGQAEVPGLPQALAPGVHVAVEPAGAAGSPLPPPQGPAAALGAGEAAAAAERLGAVQAELEAARAALAAERASAAEEREQLEVGRTALEVQAAAAGRRATAQ